MLAGLTQTYGLIPFVVGAGVWALSALIGARRKRWDLAIAALAAVALVVALDGLWSLLIPHEARPALWGSLALNFDMFRYYAHLWSFAGLALLPFFILTLRWVGMRPLIGSTYALALWLTVLAFALLTFFTQSPEARLTYVYQPVLFLALMALTAPEIGPDALLEGDRWLERLSQFTAALVLLETLVVVPDASLPSIPARQFSASQTWLGQAFTAEPQDRFLLADYCPSLAWVCSEAQIPTGPDAPTIRIQAEYRRYQRQAAERGYFGAGVTLSRPPRLAASPSSAPPSSGPPRPQAALPSRLRKLPTPTGYLESVTQAGANVEVSGWAADTVDKKAVVRLHVYLQGKAAASGPPLWPRPDVSAALHLADSVKTGFRIQLPGVTVAPEPESLRVFAEFADGTFAELTSTLH